MSDVFEVVSGVGIVSKSGASGSYKSLSGCHTLLCNAYLAGEETFMATALVLAFEGGGKKRCGTTEWSVLSTALYSSAAGRVTFSIRRAAFCL